MGTHQRIEELAVLGNGEVQEVVHDHVVPERRVNAEQIGEQPLNHRIAPSPGLLLFGDAEAEILIE